MAPALSWLAGEREALISLSQSVQVQSVGQSREQ